MYSLSFDVAKFEKYSLPQVSGQYVMPDDSPLWQDSCHHLKFNQLGALRVDSVSL